ncbi:MAG: tRNA 5-methoxyuridine(34)/uridine 5-oxyacetic acid(34) synthase CmoB [Verrucomicrobiota bacterium]
MFWDYEFLYRELESRGLDAWVLQMRSQVADAFDFAKNGHLKEWHQAITDLPVLESGEIQLTQGTVTANAPASTDADTVEYLRRKLQILHPWRKGPYHIHGLDIDTEWRSDWKWRRLQGGIEPLGGRTVLDVGCGNGYHCWRMAGEEAELVVGIDPYLLYVSQFWAVQHFINHHKVWVLPLAFEDMPDGLNCFDTVFSMGVLYHQKSPFEHLQRLKDCLREGGELVLETLVIEGHENEVLIPRGRYAKMRNVWFIPSLAMIEGWLQRVGYKNVRCIDVSKTTVEEQRSTIWMRFESLENFLDPSDPEKTVEGHSAPLRAIFVASN